MTARYNGVVLLDKPAGVSSFGCLGSVKKRLRTTRVGHAGTLDPFATGLLVSMCGCCTKLGTLFEGMPKKYEARMVFGLRTDTLDPEGAVVERGPVPPEADIESALDSFRGEIQQRPPSYSALHVQGKRAYELARSGETVALAPRRVVVHDLHITTMELPELRFRLVCSKGTYVRALARDLAIALGTCGSLLELRRLGIGPFDVEEAVEPDSLDPERDLLDPMALADRFGLLSVVVPLPSHEQRIRNGGALDDSHFEVPPERDGILAAYTREGCLLALIERRSGSYTYRAVVARD